MLKHGINGRLMFFIEVMVGKEGGFISFRDCNVGNEILKTSSSTEGSGILVFSVPRKNINTQYHGALSIFLFTKR
jgi:hypothetical protein